MAEPFKLPSKIDGTTWDEIASKLWAGGNPPRGMSRASDESISPAITNREAIALVQALRSAAAMSVATTSGPREAWPLWYQYAAVAYGWDPDRDKLDTSEKQRDAIYDPDMGALLFQQIVTMMGELDDAGRALPELELDAGAFGDPIMQGDVVHALKQDGARAEVITGFRGSSAARVPVPMCRDRKTGKARVPYEPCDKDGKGRRWIGPDGRPIELPCDNPGDCEPVVVSVRTDLLAAILLLGGIIYIAAPAALSGAIAGRVARKPRRDRRRNGH